MPLVHIEDRLTEDRYVTQFVEPVVLPLSQGAPNMVFQHVNTRLHVALRILNKLTELDILSCPTNTSALRPIEQLCDLMDVA
ncbi:hypothetical protein TNCV_3340761 [Trichonephila clavipes]|nr:hypothetical protein TNCV_3340761 [Trichonephila clavipes]